MIFALSTVLFAISLVALHGLQAALQLLCAGLLIRRFGVRAPVLLTVSGLTLLVLMNGWSIVQSGLLMMGVLPELHAWPWWSVMHGALSSIYSLGVGLFLVGFAGLVWQRDEPLEAME